MSFVSSFKALSPLTKGRLLVLLGVLWSTPDTLLILLVTCDNFTMLFWRQLFAGLSLLAVSLVLDGPRAIIQSLKTAKLAILLGAVLTAVYTASFGIAVTLAPAASVLVIVSSNPIVTAGFERIFLGERLKIPTLIAIFMGSVSIGVMFLWDLQSGEWLGYFLAAMTAVFLAGFLVLMRGVSQRLPEVTMLPCQFLAGIVLVPSFCLCLGAKPLAPSGFDFLYLVLQGLFVLPGAFTMLTLGPQMILAGEVALLLLIETVIGPLWVWLAVGQVPPRGTAVGGSLLLATLVAHSLWILRSERKAGYAENALLDHKAARYSTLNADDDEAHTTLLHDDMDDET